MTNQLTELYYWQYGFWVIIMKRPQTLSLRQMKISLNIVE